jgi:hypothetical protein
MLSGLSEIVADCYRRAAECQELARLATNEKDREFYLAREHDWLVLARSHQTAETGHKILDELDRRRGVFKTRCVRHVRELRLSTMTSSSFA